jgi:hypothetical protein
MTEELAQGLFFVLWGMGLAVWVWGLTHSVRMFRTPRGEDDFTSPDFGRGPAYPALVTGEIDVAGSAADVSEELARRLSGVVGSTFVIRDSPDGLVLTNALQPAFTQLGWANVSAAHLSIQSREIGRSRVSYELDLRPLASRLGRIALTIVLAVGLPVLLIVVGLIWFLVIPSTAPTVRWQVLQTLQVTHALWPPFLVTSRLRANARVAQASLEAVIVAAGEAVGG